jgi:hypothetical protein
MEISMALTAYRVKAFEGELQRVVQVGVALANFRISMKLRALEMRYRAFAFGSR